MITEDQADDTGGATALRARLGLITQTELATLLEVTRETLREWRRLSQGPDYVRLGKAVMYREKDVLDWMNRNSVTIMAKSTNQR